MQSSPRWLKYAILAFILVVAAAACLKYALFLYDGLDLAIYNQVLWKTVAGAPFGLTIHPHSYLGDHAEFLLMSLVPFYAFWLDPRMLLILQAIALGAGAWLLWQVAVARAAGLGVSEAWGRRAGGLLVVLYLASPTIADIGLFEFHFLPFALLPLLAAALAYERGRLVPFVAWLAAATLVREDVALVVVAFGLLAWLEKRRWVWRWTPLAVGVAGFTLGTAVIHLASGSDYQFSVYYAWLGAAPLAAARFAVIHPLAVLAHVASIANLELVLGLLMTTAFLPLLAPRRLWLAALPLAQFALNAAGGGELVLRTHYATLFLPALYLAAADGLLTLPQRRLPKWLALDRRDLARLGLPLLAVILVWNAAVLGPWLGLACAAADPVVRGRAKLAAATVAAVPADASVAASYALLPALSSRDSVYSLHYLFFGTTIFGQAPYPAPEDLTHLAVDADDFLTWRAQARVTGWMRDGYDGGRMRLTMLAGEALWHDGPFAIYARRGETPAPWTMTAETEPDLLKADVTVERGAAGLKEAAAVVTWTRPAHAEDYVVFATVVGDRGRWRRYAYPLLGLPPQAEETADGLVTRVAVPVDDLAAGAYHLQLELQRRADVMRLGPALNSIRDGQSLGGWQAPGLGWPITIE
jgi:uncharacterized membrane protein